MQTDLQSVNSTSNIRDLFHLLFCFYLRHNKSLEYKGAQNGSPAERTLSRHRWVFVERELEDGLLYSLYLISLYFEFKRSLWKTAVT